MALYHDFKFFWIKNQVIMFLLSVCRKNQEQKVIRFQISKPHKNVKECKIGGVINYIYFCRLYDNQ